MPEGTCCDCGHVGYIEQHHVFGRDNDPNTIVPLCKDCHHRAHHGFLILVENAASDKFSEWMDKQEGYIKRSDFPSKLTECGYLPVHDRWVNSQIQDDILYVHVNSDWRPNLYIYLVQNMNRSDLWKRALSLRED
jgi:hypothetical protein